MVIKIDLFNQKRLFNYNIYLFNFSSFSDNITLTRDNIDDVPIIIPNENPIDFNFTDLETILQNIKTEIKSKVKLKEKQEQYHFQKSKKPQN